MTTKNIKSGLYIVATPIGNLSDITFRAIDVLKNSDLILCEDTRTSKKLFSKYGINTKTESFHKFNEHNDYKLNTLIDMLKSGSTRNAVELMKPFGLNPNDTDFWNNGINVSIKKWLDEIECLIDKLKL